MHGNDRLPTKCGKKIPTNSSPTTWAPNTSFRLKEELLTYVYMLIEGSLNRNFRQYAELKSSREVKSVE